MSVVKSKRGKRIEFEMNYFSLADGIDNLVEELFLGAKHGPAA